MVVCKFRKQFVEVFVLRFELTDVLLLTYIYFENNLSLIFTLASFESCTSKKVVVIFLIIGGFSVLKKVTFGLPTYVNVIGIILKSSNFVIRNCVNYVYF